MTRLEILKELEDNYYKRIMKQVSILDENDFCSTIGSAKCHETKNLRVCYLNFILYVREK